MPQELTTKPMESPESVRVLAVDDSPEDLELIRLALGEAGVNVAYAGSKAEALLLLEHAEYELLLLDLVLPDGDGLDILAAARKRNSATLAIVLSGHASVRAAVDSLRHGAYDFLTKPCPAEALVAAVRRASERYLLQRDLARRTAELEALNRVLDRRVSEATSRIAGLNRRLKTFVVELMERKTAQKRLMENISHELKNPLSVVISIVAHMEGKLDRSSIEWNQYLGLLKRAGGSMQALLDELMDAYRLEEHKLVLRRAVFNPIALAEEIADAFKTVAGRKGVALSAETSPTGPIEADYGRLNQVLSNLLSNALKFTPDGGEIVVRVQSRGSAVQFTVEDSGPGIAEDKLDRIFERFCQGDTPQQQSGLGLGLEISRELVRLHGGAIWAENRPGGGARFHFTIPCKSADLGVAGPGSELSRLVA